MISFIAKGAKDEDTLATLYPTHPAGIQAGDIIFMMAINIQTPASGTISYSGTLINQVSFSWGTIALFYNIANGTESSTTIAVNRSGVSGSGTYFMAQLYQYRGAGTRLAIENTSVNNALNSTITWNAVTVGGIQRTLAAFVTNYNGGGLTGPSGYTSSASDSSIGISGTTLAVYTKENVSSDGSVTGLGDEWAAWHISLYDTPSSARSFIVN